MVNKRGNRIILMGIMMALTICLSGIISYGAEANPVRLQLDGKLIELDVAPVIVESRTLVPARAVFEALGGKVTWVKERPSDIKVEYSGKVVDLVIGSKTAMVDGVQKTLDVPAQLFPGDRTLIPVRFVTEEFGFGVDWDNDTRTVIITSPGTQPPVTGTTPPAVTLHNITGFSMQWNGNYHRVTIKADGDLSGYVQNQLDNPSRFFVDFKGFAMKVSTDTVNYNDETSVVKTVRGSQFDGDTIRIVMDLKEMKIPQISISANKQEMYLDFAKMPFEPMADGKLVVMLDPGHGITTGGKRSFDGSLMEYEFNRDVANRLTVLLEQAGIQVLNTAPTDTDTSLADRCSVANQSNADIFVSLHGNAFGTTWNSANGWEVYVYKKGGIGEEIAKSIEKSSIPKIGLKNRGVKEQNLYVLRNTDMPAVLIEHGFYTNQQELAIMKTSEFRQKCAEADAEGIINFFKPYQK